MKNEKTEKSLPRGKPVKRGRRATDPSQTTKLQESFKQKADGPEDGDNGLQPTKRISKGADEEME